MTEIGKLSKEWFTTSGTNVQKENAKNLKEGYESDKEGTLSKSIFEGKLANVRKKYSKLEDNEENKAQKELINAFGGVDNLHILFDTNNDGKVTPEEIEAVASLNMEDVEVDSNKTALSAKDLRVVFENVMSAEDPDFVPKSAVVSDSVEEIPAITISYQDVLSLKQTTEASKKAYMAARVGTKAESEAQVKYVQSVIDWANTIKSKPDASETEMKNVLAELNYIQKYKAPAVVDMVKDSKDLLTELKTRRNELVAPKNKTANAKYAYMKSPVGTKEEAACQKKYVQSVMDWANVVLAKDVYSDEEMDEVLSEMKYIQKYQAAAVVDMIKDSKELLNKLTDKYEIKLAPRREVINKKLDGVFDSEAGELLAKKSKARAGNRTESTGKCAQYVRLALEDLGLLGTEELVVGSAKNLVTEYPKTGNFAQVDIDSIDDIKLLPPGCVVVWQNGTGFGKDFEKHGHVAITQKDGKMTTDYNQDIKDYGTSFTVFVPVIKTTAQKGEDAKLAKEDLVSQDIIDKSVQSKYLNRSIQYAEALIKDGNASKDDINAAVELLKDSAKNAKYGPLRPMVKKSQNLISQLNKMNKE